MPFKTIVAIIQSKDDAERVLDCAIPLTTRFQGHLIGVHAEALPVAYTSAVGFPDTEFLQATAEVNKERAEALQADFRRRIRDANVSYEWRSLECFSGDSAHSGIASARCADLAIAAQRNPHADSTATADVDALLFESGRPVLIVPHAGPSLSSYRNVLIAWNGSREAARAAFDALPLLMEADHVEVFVIDPPEDAEYDSEASGEEIATALARHGVNINVAAETSNGRSIDQILQQRIAARGADLLVLGAYSHSWLRQLLFGGVTRTVLQSMPVATFMSR
ncbi:nucleotide-binding universal stress UspA family protein [Pseudaminobacter salicylatoxidans]|uniref:Nucleotide-binding universal stress UspA family protein n=1 Tax=Pseudaminobacter salicylatoxidans TaxID=93369 RepID=A0A316C2W1_PSESE|nr:universal stress protein [Pseudaminobacter salicylatoxidans]PWJ79441.1 nucleotide-binding universal stress UspA family protein [Pseudaminobacter salicylatoxidans]